MDLLVLFHFCLGGFEVCRDEVIDPTPFSKSVLKAIQQDFRALVHHIYRTL